MIGGLLGRILGRGASKDRLQQAELALRVLERLGKGVKDLAEFRQRVAEGAARGDLDDVISWAHRRDQRVEDFLRGNDDG